MFIRVEEWVINLDRVQACFDMGEGSGFQVIFQLESDDSAAHAKEISINFPQGAAANALRAYFKAITLDLPVLEDADQDHVCAGAPAKVNPSPEKSTLG